MAVKKSGPVQHFSGLSSDTKPTGSTVNTGSTFYELDSNDTYFTQNTSVWKVKDSKSIQRITVINTISANAAYASNDVVGVSSTAAAANTWEFPSMAGYAGGSGKIVQAEIRSNSNVCSFDPVLFLFTSSTPNSAIADNNACNAPTHPDVSAGVYVGKIPFNGNLVAQGASADAGVILYESASCLPFYYTTASDDSGLHGILMTATAATFPSKEVAVTLWYQRL